MWKTSSEVITVETGEDERILHCTVKDMRFEDADDGLLW
jgi:hypothetical protein